MRAAIAAAMTRANAEIPHAYVTQTIDLSRALAWLAETNEQRPIPGRLLYGVLLLKAVALALREVPELNGFWRDGRYVPSESVHLGVAISLRGGGLVAPALHDADRASIDELMTRFRDLVQRARSSRLRSSELADPTITVTSLGEQGVEGVFPLIFPPQVSIAGFGKVVERPWAADGGLFVRPVCHATLAADHRAVDGHRAGIFLAAVDRLLQTPEALEGGAAT
jgi:pyruvate dehydrogenase E2 component (dihydrolipoamide acetyltransferase)